MILGVIWQNAMTLNDLYLLSQILAVVALIPSVLYLAVQVRQNTLQARANAAYQFLEATGSINATLVGNKQTASVIQRGFENISVLDPDEKLQFLLFVGQHFTTHGTLYELYQNKTLPESQWHPIKKDIITFLATNGGRTIWDDFAKDGLSPDFVAYVENLTRSEEGSYSMDQLLGTKAEQTK